MKNFKQIQNQVNLVNLMKIIVLIFCLLPSTLWAQLTVCAKKAFSSMKRITETRAVCHLRKGRYAHF